MKATIKPDSDLVYCNSCQTVERLTQDLHRYGLRDFGRQVGFIPFLRIPVPENPQPETLSHKAARTVVAEFIRGFGKAEQTLALVDGAAKVPVHLARVRIDMDGDGRATEKETLWTIYTRLNARARNLVTDPGSFEFAFDRADAHWLRGYCHLLMAFGETALAHDAKELFERTAHIFFKKVDTPYDFLGKGRNVFRFGSGVDVADVIAFIHLLNFEVIEPERMSKAHAHLKSMLEQSRDMWKHAVAETDNDNEWIPNSSQAALIPNVRVTKKMIEDWYVFLDEADALLDGKKLIPFWRGAEDDAQVRGVNLRKVFLEPTRFDLVMWVQGTGAAPYLEEGEITRSETWSRLQQTFRGNFWGFAIWFN